VSLDGPDAIAGKVEEAEASETLQLAEDGVGAGEQVVVEREFA
jgi:hypothetical protein